MSKKSLIKHIRTDKRLSGLLPEEQQMLATMTDGKWQNMYVLSNMGGERATWLLHYLSFDCRLLKCEMRKITGVQEGILFYTLTDMPF